MAIRCGDQEVEDERKPDREHEEAAVPEVPYQFVADSAGWPHRRTSLAAISAPPFALVNLRKACSSRALVSSIPRASGNESSSARNARSASVQRKSTVSPRRSTLSTPGSITAVSGASTSVARIVRRPTIALISLV